MKTTLTVLLIIKLCGLVSCVLKEHYFINEGKTWDDALQYCRTYYHHLSTFIDATEEQQFLQDAASRTSDAWIGLKKTSGTWMWTTGEATTQISWDFGEPNNGDCARLDNARNKLRDTSSLYGFAFFCMTVTEFVVVQQSESWDGALEHCRHHYDDLASLNSSRRMDYALSKITEAQTRYVWIGLRFLAGEWFWISGDDVIFNVWSSDGQPQCPDQNQRCVALDKITNTWTHRDCEEKLNFLCFASPENIV